MGKEKSQLRKSVEGMVKTAFFKKFVWNRAINKDGLTGFLKDIVPFWNSASIYSTIKKVVDSFYVKYNRMKKNDELKRLQNKYPDLKIFETYFYLSLEKKFANKKEDFEIFERAIQILLSKKIRFDYEEEEKSNKQYKLS